MAKTSNGSIGVTVSGDGTTETYAPQGSPVQNLAAPSGGTTPLVLAAGNQTVTPPAGAIGVIFAPPTASTNAKTLKGVNGDTGVPLRANAPSLVYFPNTPGTFVINSAGIETIDLHWL